MSVIEWSDKLSVNIKEIDEQHKKLVETINTLFDAMSEGKGRGALREVLTMMADYANYHFVTEESLMSQFGYPSLEEHRREHQAFIAKVSDFLQGFQAEKLSVTMELVNFLVYWLNTHIMGTDKRYGPFLNNKGIY